MLLQDRAADPPIPPYYEYHPSLAPHRFLGRGMFVAQRIDQMRVAKSYLVAHSSWFDRDPDTTCPPCRIEPQSFQRAILTCPAPTRAWDLLLQEVSTLGCDATLGPEHHLIPASGEDIMDTRAGFPSDMIPDCLPTSSLPLST